MLAKKEKQIEKFNFKQFEEQGKEFKALRKEIKSKENTGKARLEQIEFLSIIYAQLCNYGDGSIMLDFPDLAKEHLHAERVKSIIFTGFASAVTQKAKKEKSLWQGSVFIEKMPGIMGVTKGDGNSIKPNKLTLHDEQLMMSAVQDFLRRIISEQGHRREQHAFKDKVTEGFLDSFSNQINKNVKEINDKVVRTPDPKTVKSTRGWFWSSKPTPPPKKSARDKDKHTKTSKDKKELSETVKPK